MTKLKDIKCRKCGRNAMEAAERGNYLKRVNDKGEPAINECAPSCFKTGDNDDAVIRAISK